MTSCEAGSKQGLRVQITKSGTAQCVPPFFRSSVVGTPIGLTVLVSCEAYQKFLSESVRSSKYESLLVSTGLILNFPLFCLILRSLDVDDS